jgi:TolB protein
VSANRLSVIDLDTGSITDVAGPRTAAFFWAPGGDRLLVLEGAEEDPGTFRWSVWTPTEMERYGSFVPGRDWVLEFLPFFDQYAQSIRLWAPDGSAFAFPGSIDERSGIWVQRLDADEPERISDGTWVDWSPAGVPAL